MNRQSRPRLSLVASMVIFGTLAPFVRRIPLSSAALALCRAVMAAAVLALYLLLRGRRLSLRALGREGLLLLLSGAAMGFNWILLFQAYRYTTVSVATLSYYFAPVLVTLACPLLFRERLTPRQWLCSGFSTLGIVFITLTGGLPDGGAHLTGVLFGLGAAALYAAVVLLNKAIRRVGGTERALLQFLAAAAVLAPYTALSGGLGLGRLDGAGLLCLLAVGLVHTGAAYCLYFSSLAALPGQTAAILSYIDPLVAVLISVTVLGEPMTLRQLLGGALILGFTLLNELAPARGESRDRTA